MEESVAPTETVSGSSLFSTTHEIRITSSGKISNWVEFALKFLKSSPDAKLTLHTLPPDLKGKGKAPERPAADDVPSRKEKLQPPSDASKAKKRVKQGSGSGMHPSTNTIAKLISVTEIIKREYLKLPDSGLIGLYQYNELGTLEDIGLAPQQETGGDGEAELVRSQAIVQALDGVKNVRIQRTPYMRITLSPKEIPDLAAVTHPATAQRPEKRHLTKSAKGRLKKRLKKNASGEGAEAVEV